MVEGPPGSNRTPLIILDALWRRVERDRTESDTALFNSLMYLGEAATKLTALGLVAAIRDDKDRLRYQQLHALVRADGLGDWSNSIDNVLTGPPAQFLHQEAYAEQRELTQRVGDPAWQHAALHALHECSKHFGAGATKTPSKAQGRQWFQDFCALRNKTRGHGAPSPTAISQACIPLESSLILLTKSFSLFRRPWAHLRQNLSGKHHVVPLTDDASAFGYLAKEAGERFADGVYVFLGVPNRVELLVANDSKSEFFFPNGAFTKSRFELMSYATGTTMDGDATPYLNPPGKLPPSETQGANELQARGECLTNAPPPAGDYVQRETLETELGRLLMSEAHPIATLVGRGGIGKTSLALTAIQQITSCRRFDAIFWFSARDIDLTIAGPKQVRPDVLDIGDVAREYSRLVGQDTNVDSILSLEQALQRKASTTALFVFDNFETVRSPIDVYKWLDNNIRPPNKVLITTRMRDFKGDYPLEVRGMNDAECNSLIDNSAARFGIATELDPRYRREMIEQSGGHPYVLKMLLAQVRRSGGPRNAARILASSEDLLAVLFERTYAGLSAASQRLFLTLCNWNSTIAAVALEAVLLRNVNEVMGVQMALDELDRFSLIEVRTSEFDKQLFVHVPLAAQLFGRTKLRVDALRSAVEADTEMLHRFGAASPSDVRRGLRPRVAQFVKSAARDIETKQRSLEYYLPVLEFVARREPNTWLDIARLHEESEDRHGIEKAKDSVRQYLQSTDDQQVDDGRQRINAWQYLLDLCRISHDVRGELNALIALCRSKHVSYTEISSAANRFNTVLTQASPNDIEFAEKRVIARELMQLMHKRINEADATDMSRLAWLCLHLGQVPAAKAHVEKGLEVDPDNRHLLGLRDRLQDER